MVRRQTPPMLDSQECSAPLVSISSKLFRHVISGLLSFIFLELI